MKSSRRRRATTFLCITIVALGVSASAYAFESYVYAYNYLAPGGYVETGYNDRDWNLGCRESNSGLASVSYYNSAGTRVNYTGAKWTNCYTEAYAKLSNNGYFKSRCTHEGTVNWVIVCETTRGYDNDPNT